MILLVSVGLGFSNEYRAETAAEALHSTRARTAPSSSATGCHVKIDVTALVPGDVVHLTIGRSFRPICGC